MQGTIHSMFRIRGFFLCVLMLTLLLPVGSAQAAPAVNGENICPPNASGDPTGTKKFLIPAQPTKIDSYLKQKVMCPNACFNVKAVISVSSEDAKKFLVITTTAANMCGKPDPTAEDALKKNRGCAKGQIAPGVTVQSPAIEGSLAKPRLEGPRSRCDAAVAKVINTFAQGDLEKAFDGVAALTVAVPTVNLSTPDGRNQIIKELAAGTGASLEEAKAIVERDPEAAIKAINAISTGDQAQIKETVEAIGLNPDLVDKVALRAAVAENNDLPPADGDAPAERVVNPDGTFAGVTSPAIASIVAPMCAQLGGCGENACLSNPYSLTCLGKNPGALTFTPWQAKYGGRPCGLNNNTTCFDTIEGGIAAQANLLTTSPRYFAGGNNTILGAFCNGYSTSNCSQYAAFISGQTGIPMNQTIDPNNTQQIAAIMMASSRFENGRGVIYTPEQLQKGLEVAFGNGTLPEGTPGYVPRTVYGTNGGTQFGSPFSPYSSASPTNVGYGSAFGNAPPAPVAQQPASTPQQTSSTQTTPTSQTGSQNTGTQTQGTSTQSGVAKQLQDALKDPNAKSTTASPANIVIQQKEVTRGNPIMVSWTSVGMSADTPCVLRANSTAIAEGNQGSKTVPTTQATQLGSLIFTLACTTQSGTAFQRTAAVMVR